MLDQGRERVQRMKPITPSTSASSTISLDSLPTELLHLIASYLPRSALVSSKLTSKELLLRLPEPRVFVEIQREVCERHNLRRCLLERGRLQAGRRLCINCRQVAPLCRFRSDAPVCMWHDGAFLSLTVPVFLENSLKAQLAARIKRIEKTEWIAVHRTYCAHTRDVIGWDIASCRCRCNCCGHFTVRCYVRLSKGSEMPFRAAFDRDQRKVIETFWADGNDHPHHARGAADND